MTFKLIVGHTYENGCGARLRIIAAPNKRSRWFEDEVGYRYHETGEYAGLSYPEFNLVTDVTSPKKP